MELRVNNFQVIGKIGEGAHGVVLRAFDSKNKQYVALKRILCKQEESLSIAAMREVQSLQHVSSPYVMRLLGVVSDSPSILLVLDLMAGGLSTLIYDVTHPLTVSQCKAYARMTLTGLMHLHQASIMHRDLKPANLLIGYDGILRIADLGQARLAKDRPFSHQVGSRWYRAPELLYGSRRYCQAVDIWSFGCILAELINRAPLFPGESDIEQLAILTRSIGTPSEIIWPDLRNLPDYEKITFPLAKGKSWKRLLPDSPPGAINFIESLVTYNPVHRLSAQQALSHRFFAMEPRMLNDNEMSLPLGFRSTIGSVKRKEIYLDQAIDEITTEFNHMFLTSSSDI